MPATSRIKPSLAAINGRPGNYDIVPIHQQLAINQLFGAYKTLTSLFRLLPSKNTSMQDFPVESIQIVSITNQLEASTARIFSVQEIKEVWCS